MTVFAFDTSVLVYAEGLERNPADHRKIRQSRGMIDNLLKLGAQIVVSAQVIAELHNVLLTEKGFPVVECSKRVRGWIDLTTIHPTNLSVINEALRVAATAKLKIFDAIILAAAVEAGCDLLVSEDFQDGFAWRGIVVTNPFGPTPDRRLPLD